MTVNSNPDAPKKREPRLFVVLVLMMVSMIASRYILPSGRVGNLPGPARGDLVLQEQDLPAELAGWKKVQFIPAADPLAVANVESWWVHSWNFAKDGYSCLVTLDQAQWVAWHELSACYVANGWIQLRHGLGLVHLRGRVVTGLAVRRLPVVHEWHCYGGARRGVPWSRRLRRRTSAGIP